MFKYAVLGLALMLTINHVTSLSRSRFERQANNTNYYRPLGGVHWTEPRHQHKSNNTLNKWGNQYQPPTGNVYNATRPGNIRPGWTNNSTNTYKPYQNNTNNYQRPVDNNYQRPVDNNYQRQVPVVPVTPTPLPVHPIATPATRPTQPPFGSGYNTGNINNRNPYNANVQLSYDVPGSNNAKQPQRPQNIPSSNPWGRL